MVQSDGATPPPAAEEVAVAEAAEFKARMPPHPRQAIFVRPAALTPLITAAILQTGDRLAAGLPVDGAASLRRRAAVERAQQPS